MDGTLGIRYLTAKPNRTGPDPAEALDKAGLSKVGKY